MHNFKYSDCYSYPNDDVLIQLGPETDGHIRQISAAFERNMQRVGSLVMLPPFMVNWGRTKQLIDCMAWHRVTARPIPPPPGHPEEGKHNADVDYAAAEIAAAITQGPEWRDGTAWNRGIHDLEYILQSVDALSLRPGIDAILSAMAMGVFTAFESLATDLWVTVVNYGPKEIAERVAQSQLSQTRGDSKSVKVQEKSIGISDLRAYGYDLRYKMGTVLKDQGKVHFESVSNTAKAYLAAFGGESGGIFDGSRWEEIRLLENIRNLYAHRGGEVDAPFLEQTSGAGFAGLRVGDLFPITGTLCAKMAASVVAVSKQLVELSVRKISAIPRDTTPPDVRSSDTVC